MKEYVELSAVRDALEKFKPPVYSDQFFDIALKQIPVLFIEENRDGSVKHDITCANCQHRSVCKYFPYPLNKCNFFEPRRIDASIYDCEDRVEHCTVEILRNSVTGQTSVGWWKE